MNSHNNVKIRRWWKYVLGSIAIVSTILTYYSDIREKGKIILCDVGVFDFLQCGSKYIYFASNSERDAAIHNLSNKLIDDDRDAILSIEESVWFIFESGSRIERKAMTKISKGNIEEGLQELEVDATISANDSSSKWRRLGRLAYATYPNITVKAYEELRKTKKETPIDMRLLSKAYNNIGSLDNIHSIQISLEYDLPIVVKADWGPWSDWFECVPTLGQQIRIRRCFFPEAPLMDRHAVCGGENSKTVEYDSFKYSADQYIRDVLDLNRKELSLYYSWRYYPYYPGPVENDGFSVNPYFQFELRDCASEGHDYLGAFKILD